MSLLQSCSYVPEMLMDAPKEIRKADAARKIRECVGAAFVKLYKLGCIVTVRSGNGVVLRRKEDGSWGAPCAVQMFGPALGASIGVEVCDYIIFFSTEMALQSFVKNVGTVGVNGSLSAGPIGRQGEALMTTGSKEGLTVFCSSKGLYGGVSLEFGGVIVDKTANNVMYGRPIAPSEILNSEPAPTGEIFQKMYAALKDIASAPLDEPEMANASPETQATQQ